MPDDVPIACSLGDGELQQRLAAIAEVGARSLLSRTMHDETHLLRFRLDPGTRRQLEGIVVAEAKCCSFLDLSLREDEGELVMSIAAAENARALAGDLARAFGGGEGVAQ